MNHLGKYRRWITAASLAAVLLIVLVLGMSIASAQTATPEATGTVTATAGATGTAEATDEVTGTATMEATAVATGTATAVSSPTGAATSAPGATATRTPGAATTRTPTAVATRTPTPTITGSLQISLPQQSYLPLELALQAASAALEECEDMGYPVAVTIVDRSGVEKVVLKGDGTGTATLGSSFKKAFTAASLGSSTFGLVDRVTKDPTLAGLAFMDERMILLAGGIPIRAGNEVVGGIGVGGAPSGLIDEECAQAGLDALEDE